MKVKRKMTVTTEQFVVGDIIEFKLNDGEKMQAMAVQETSNGMLFMAVDCLEKEYPMFASLENVSENYFTYENSDLRKTLNKEILTRFPREIRKRMVALDNGDFLRIPTVREIFGKIYGRGEPDTVKQFYGIKNFRNRIASKGSETNIWTWYWLQNKNLNHSFSLVSIDGNYSHYYANNPNCVRLVFLLAGVLEKESSDLVDHD